MALGGGLVLGLHTFMILLNSQESRTIKGECWGWWVRRGDFRAAVTRETRDQCEMFLSLSGLWATSFTKRSPIPLTSIMSFLDPKGKCPSAQPCRGHVHVQASSGSSASPIPSLSLRPWSILLPSSTQTSLPLLGLECVHSQPALLQYLSSCW